MQESTSLIAMALFVFELPGQENRVCIYEGKIITWNKERSMRNALVQPLWAVIYRVVKAVCTTKCIALHSLISFRNAFWSLSPCLYFSQRKMCKGKNKNPLSFTQKLTFPLSRLPCVYKIRFPGRGLRAQVLQEVGSTASPYTAGPLGEKA